MHCFANSATNYCEVRMAPSSSFRAGTSSSDHVGLQRGLSTTSALGVNIIDMVGVGPFVTLPLIVTTMGGPQAMFGWLLGALLSLCDGLIWSELGTAYPEAGGSYVYLKHLYGGQAFGRAISFLYAWQLLFSAPLSIASGCIGFSQYLSYFLPHSGQTLFSVTLLHIPFILSQQSFIAMAVCLLAVAVLYRKIHSIERVVKSLGIVVVLALLWIIFAGFTHFNAHQAFDFPPGAFHLNSAFLAGLGAGMLISAYDYWGYYNICFLGGEVRDPQRSIPRAVLGSITIVGALYLMMNISVLGVVPWRELTSVTAGNARMYIMAVVMQRIYGHAAAVVIVLLISLAAAASVLALLLGYSRIPYAAARDGNFPAIFGRLHPRFRIPHVSLVTLACMTLFCCLFRLQEVISTLVVIRILFQFLLQGVGVLLPRHRHARRAGKFKMVLYPIPVFLALAGFLFILFSRVDFSKEMRTSGSILLVGAIVYGIRLYRNPTRQSQTATRECSPTEI
jgi:amino acid transporter